MEIKIISKAVAARKADVTRNTIYNWADREYLNKYYVISKSGRVNKSYKINENELRLFMKGKNKDLL